MIERPGSSVALSIAIAAAAAVVLHNATARNLPTVEPRPAVEVTAAPTPAPSVTPSQPWPEPYPTAPPRVAPPRAPARPRRRADLTRAEVGESLADLGRRVYGDGFDLERLWKLNRDQVASRDAPLRAGMTIRTPAL